ncbi:hypothetical protein [Mucilaginibacter sp.]|uniref:hypothetical protein n=1 Tax=Mucilaginibacter sp. TaxID=1882438 RepID=UPI0025E735E2|nr:hypothetical protein [Mucilaginibacter sp.]
MKPVRGPAFKLILAVLLLAALIICVIIYYNRRIAMIEHKLKQTSVLIDRYNLKGDSLIMTHTAGTNTYRHKLKKVN